MIRNLAIVSFVLAFSLESVEGWLTTGGYFVLFGLLFACGLGLPLPEDIPLMAAGVMIANGKMTWALAGFCAWCGIIGGDIVLYNLGRKFGLEITRVPFVGKHVTRQRIERAEQLFEKYGVWVVAIGRLFAGIRGAMVVAAGAIRYNFIKFIVADSLAAIVSGGFFIWLGHLLGNQLRQHMDEIDRYKHYVFGGLLVLVVAVVVFLWWRKRKKAGVPGPAGRKAVGPTV